MGTGISSQVLRLKDSLSKEVKTGSGEDWGYQCWDRGIFWQITRCVSVSPSVKMSRNIILMPYSSLQAHHRCLFEIDLYFGSPAQRRLPNPRLRKFGEIFADRCRLRYRRCSPNTDGGNKFSNFIFSIRVNENSLRCKVILLERSWKTDSKRRHFEKVMTSTNANTLNTDIGKDFYIHSRGSPSQFPKPPPPIINHQFFIILLSGTVFHEYKPETQKHSSLLSTFRSGTIQSINRKSADERE